MATAATDRMLPTLGPLGGRLVGAVGRWLKRRGRLSIRGLVVLVLVVGGGLGWEIRSAREQRAAVAAIHARGGYVAYDIEWQLATPNPHRDHSWHPRQLLDRQLARHPWLDRAIRRVGIDHFGNVVVVRISQNWSGQQPNVGAATMAQIGRLRRLDILSLDGTTVTDADLAALKDLADLRYLVLSDTNITDAGLVHLAGLLNLATLHVGGTKVTAAGVARLKRALPALLAIR